jgi:LysR family transcriptional regulator, glycine cleavage system transcriptional activator
MSHRLPPLNGLRAFEAAARHLSFKRAADELAVTPGAVSQQVKTLERAMGVTLFRRLHRALVLTPSGEALVPPISAAFHTISKAMEAAAPALKGRRLKLGVARSLLKAGGPAIDWLSTEKARKLVDARTSDDVATLMAGKLDALLRPAGGGTYPGFHSLNFELATSEGGRASAVLVSVPGLAGCREHEAVVRALHRAQDV